MSSYSKGSRGLSVLPRVHCIFTASSISLSLGWTALGHHYAISCRSELTRQGISLYLRTVIALRPPFTRASIKSFSLRITHQLTFRHRAGVTPYTSTFVFAQCCVFNKQLQPAGIFDWSQLPPQEFHTSVPSPEVTAPFCPSSFARVLSSALVFLYLTTCVGLGYDFVLPDA